MKTFLTALCQKNRTDRRSVIRLTAGVARGAAHGEVAGIAGTHHVRVLDLLEHLDVVELDVEVLVDALEDAADLDVVLELDGDLVVDQGFEEAGVVGVRLGRCVWNGECMTRREGKGGAVTAQGRGGGGAAKVACRKSKSSRTQQRSKVVVKTLKSSVWPRRKSQPAKKLACHNRKRAHIPEEQHFERGAAARNQETRRSSAMQ